MLILGIESSGLTASAAVLDDEKLIAEYTVNNAMTHSQTLMPMIDSVMKSAGKEPEELDAIAISRGPGSFTGLRIGSATAKGLGLALNKPLVEVPTLDAMAYSLYGITDRIVCPIMDARRSEVYSGAYVFEKISVDNSNETVFNMKNILPENAGPVEELVEKLEKLMDDSGKTDENPVTNGLKGVLFLGDGVKPYRELILGKMKTGCSFAPEFLSRQRAASVAALGMEVFRQGKYISADDHAPVYLRMSQAEREAAKA
ncbi:MAG: tRNA (adenosine(37)-N6)-threonylcarbamoyltransferase complex dimerization subunit type 1 TsaB [Lachnospiraceae bacterium]|nr:tRNA (adenosine(37)-N6)-threonylcarbamoyltransferase complex dimerization subunit type 1 TsaB [Lachnospiraceae bacterium]